MFLILKAYILLPKSKAGMAELLSLFLMWILTENANISEHDKKFVLSAIDLDKPTKIFEPQRKLF